MPLTLGKVNYILKFHCKYKMITKLHTGMISYNFETSNTKTDKLKSLLIMSLIPIENYKKKR